MRLLDFGMEMLRFTGPGWGAAAGAPTSSSSSIAATVLVARSGGGSCSLCAQGSRLRGRRRGSRSWCGLWRVAAVPVAEVGRALARIGGARVAAVTGAGRLRRRLQDTEEPVASGPSGLSGLGGLGGLSYCPGRGTAVVVREAAIRIAASMAPVVWRR